MRYIDKQNIELDLPANWEAKVSAARVSVAGKMKQARAKARGDGKSLEEINVAAIKAKHKAINAKSSIWGELKELLGSQSYDKCWYCESTELRSDNPIDHFRPKNSIAECEGHPGYWWLAFSWDNYRYTCTYCNSRRVEQETEGGKQDHFPLIIPPKWGRFPGAEIGERPMLLDPCDSEDPKLLSFNTNGEAVPSISDNTSDEYNRADQSIELYHLNHKPTTRQRKQIYVRIRQLVADTDELIAAGIADNRGAIKSNKMELIRMIRPSCKSTSFNTAAKIYLRQFQELEWVSEILERD
jgi:uncharacterized protein (TIGR02646 family)